MSNVWIGYKRLILKLSEVLIIEEVEGPYMHPNQRLIPIWKWYASRDIQPILINQSASLEPQAASPTIRSLGSLTSTTQYPNPGSKKTRLTNP